MSTKRRYTRQQLKSDLALSREVLRRMEIEKIELLLDTFISVLILGVSVSYGSNLDIAILAVTVIQGLKLPRLVRAYHQVKTEQDSRQTTFDK